MATKKKQSEKETSREGWSRAALPLPSHCSGDAEKDAEGDVLAMLQGDALDIGDQRWDGQLSKSLKPKERREYQAAFEVANRGQTERLAWLAAIMKVAGKSPEGRARLTEIAASKADPLVRKSAAEALLEGRPSAAELESITTMLSLPGDQLHARGAGAKAAFLLGKAASFDRLAPMLPDQAVMMGLMAVAPAIDERWLDRLLALVHGSDLGAQFAAMMVLARLPHDPRMVDALLKHFGMPAKELTFIAQQALVLLARADDARALPYLNRALEISPYWDLAVEGLVRIGDPVAVHALRRHRERSAGAHPNWPGFVTIDTAIAALEKIGPVPPEPIEAPAKPKKRERRKVTKAPKVVVSPFVPVDQQRKDLVELLATESLDKHADALIEPAIELIARRHDETKLPFGGSRLGGHPDLPKGMAWPKVGEIHLGFVAQIDLSQVDSGGVLPSAGLLSFFVMDELEGGYIEHARVFHFENVSELVRVEVPEDFDKRPEGTIREPYLACALELRPLLRLPSGTHAKVAEKLDEAERRRYAALDLYNGIANQLLGFREQGYDATPADVQLLLQVTSEDQALMEWGDVEALSFLIPKEALRARDWSKVYPYVGD